MTAKEKAKELIEKFEPYADYQECDVFTERERLLINAKQSALISVTEILNLLNSTSFEWSYWYEVESEIENYG